MSLAQRDYILRIIEQLGQALARIAGKKREGKIEQALEELNQTEAMIFGPLLETLRAVDGTTAAALIGTTDKIRVLGLLTAERADLERLSGRASKAQREGLRALELYAEALCREATLGDADRAAIAALRGWIDPIRIEDSTRRALDAIVNTTNKSAG